MGAGIQGQLEGVTAGGRGAVQLVQCPLYIPRQCAVCCVFVNLYLCICICEFLFVYFLDGRVQGARTVRRS